MISYIEERNPWQPWKCLRLSSSGLTASPYLARRTKPVKPCGMGDEFRLQAALSIVAGGAEIL
jgi:hypothetical protein